MRDGTNTAIFITAIMQDISIPKYRENLAKLIQDIQGMQFEPYVVSQHEELLDDSNLFIRLSKESIPMKEMIPWFRDVNLILMDDILFDRTDIAWLLTRDQAFDIIFTPDYHFAGFACRKDGRDWLDFITKVVKERLYIPKYTLCKYSHKLKLP